MRFVKLLTVATTLCLSACGSLEYPVARYDEMATRVTTLAPDPDAASGGQFDPALVHRGQYLAQIMGCGSCHTDGALVGRPNPAKLFAGSDVGIAYTDPARDVRPGVAFPANLTPDRRTGIGTWTDMQIAEAIRTGWHGTDGKGLMVMPWRAYTQLSAEDTQAIVAYLRSIPAIEHQVPARAAPGVNARAPYVYFGVYRSQPEVNAGH